MKEPRHYIGSELELFLEAKNWKSYWASLVAPELSGRVLEVGAGIGANIGVLSSRSGIREWVALEPDPDLAKQVRSKAGAANPNVLVGTLDSLPQGERFDAILYIDVLEHIEDDAAEFKKALNLLRPGGKLVVLAPAHSWLFSDFDRSIGHFRRYSSKTLSHLALGLPLELRSLRYLDCMGIVASAANRIFLRKKLPTAREILFWDRCLVPLSRGVDPLIGYRLGKSVLGIWARR